MKQAYDPELRNKDLLKWKFSISEMLTFSFSLLLSRTFSYIMVTKYNRLATLLYTKFLSKGSQNSNPASEAAAFR